VLINVGILSGKNVKHVIELNILIRLAHENDLKTILYFSDLNSKYLFFFRKLKAFYLSLSWTEN
jgi:hypothetical protein